jgi:starvation-inducible DNA-binding protein
MRWSARRARRLLVSALVGGPPTAKTPTMNNSPGSEKRASAFPSPGDIRSDGVTNISTVLNTLVADLFDLYLKTKDVHWCVSGSHFRDYRLLLDEQAKEIYSTTDSIGVRIEELGATTFRDYYLLLDEQANQIEAFTDAAARQVKKFDATILPPTGHHSRPRPWSGNDADHTLRDMLAGLCEDNLRLAASLRQTQRVCDEYADVATASLIEIWTHQAERRISLLEAIEKPGCHPYPRRAVHTLALVLRHL